MLLYSQILPRVERLGDVLLMICSVVVLGQRWNDIVMLDGEA